MARTPKVKPRDAKTPGQRVAVARALNGWNQGELAEILGTDQPRVSNWETGTEAPGLDYLSAVARVSGVSLDWLVNGPATSVEKDARDAADDYRRVEAPKSGLKKKAQGE